MGAPGADPRRADLTTERLMQRLGPDGSPGQAATREL